MAVSMIDCPYCERKVLSNDGTCPGCHGNLTDESAIIRQQAKRKGLSIAQAARAQGESLGEIESLLIKEGFDEGIIQEIMPKVEGKTPEGMKAKNNSEMRHGLYWLAAGMAVSVVSFMIASSSKEGGVYVIAWGAIIAGGIQFLRAFLKSN